jgi:hypothetical protein
LQLKLKKKIKNQNKTEQKLTKKYLLLAKKNIKATKLKINTRVPNFFNINIKKINKAKSPNLNLKKQLLMLI